MNYIEIPGTDLKVSRVCLGTWVYGGDCWGYADDIASIRTVEAAIEKGINFIDTAPVYGSGRSEEIIGKVIKGKRDKVVIATKLGLQQSGHSIKPNLSPAYIREEIDNSLKRLGVETIDLYQCHWPDPSTEQEDTFKAMNKLVDSGKVRYIGVSNYNTKQLEEALASAKIVTNQVQYSIFDRRIEADLLPFCENSNVSILSYGSLGGGILTGKYKEPPAISKGDVRSFFYKYYKEPFWTKAVTFIQFLETIAEKYNADSAQAAINWILCHERVASCIVGCRTTEQMDMNIKSMLWKLTDEDVRAIGNEYNNIFGTSG